MTPVGAGPLLFVRMLGTACFMDDSLVIMQSERSQFRARGSVIRMKNASNLQTFRDMDVHVVNLNETVERPIGGLTVTVPFELNSFLFLMVFAFSRALCFSISSRLPK